MSSEMSLSFTDSEGEVFTIEDVADGTMIAFSVETPSEDVMRILIDTSDAYTVIEMLRKVADRQLGGA